MASKTKTLPNGLRDLETFKAAIQDRRGGMSLAAVSEKHYRNATRLPADLRKCRDLVDNPAGAKEDVKVAKCIIAKWDEASTAAGKAAGGSRAKPMAAADAKAMMDAINAC